MATAWETFQLWSLSEPYMHIMEFANLPPHEICRDCCNQAQYICLEDGNILPSSLNAWFNSNIQFCEKQAPQAPASQANSPRAAQAALHMPSTSSANQRPSAECRQESILTSEPPRSYLSSKIHSTEIATGSEV